MLIAGGGFLIGAPMGLLHDPTGLMYGLLSYLSGVAAIVIGWRDGREEGEPTLLTNPEVVDAAAGGLRDLPVLLP